MKCRKTNRLTKINRVDFDKAASVTMHFHSVQETTGSLIYPVNSREMLSIQLG